MLRFLAALALCAFATTSVSAQDWWIPDRADNYLSILASGPAGGESAEWRGFPTGGLVVSGHFAFGKGAFFLMDVPFGAYRLSVPGGTIPNGDRTSFDMGNPYVGIGVRRGSHRLQLGARLPLAKSSDNVSGLFGGMQADLTEGFERWAADVAAFSATGSSHFNLGSSAALEVTASPVYLRNIDGFEKGESDLFARYGVKLSANAGPVAVSSGYSAMTILTGDAESFSDRTLSNLVLAVGRSAGRLRPSTTLRLPLGDYKEIMDFDVAVGFGLTVGL